MAVVNPTSSPTESVATPRTVWFGPFVPDRLEREFMAFLGAHNGVGVLTWPRDLAHAEHLARAGVPRLLLVPPSEAPPEAESLQDWLPAGASEAKIHARLRALARAAEAHRAAAGAPTFDEHGSLHVGDTSVAVPVLERAVAALLVDHFEQPVAATDLTYASNSGSHGALHGRLCQLGQLVNMLGFEIAPASDDSYVLRRCGQ